MREPAGALGTINAVAPVRICDIGGWTDTWFAEHGRVLNIAVYPYVEVQIHTRERDTDDRVRIVLENFRAEYSVNPERIVLDKHPLIEAAIDTMDIPTELAFDVNIYSDAPPGASTGTSAAVSVALIGALDRLTPGRLTAHEIASLAHSLETEKLGLQSGVQDQLCSAYGGVNYIDIPRFPSASVSPITIPNAVWWELENRLMLVYIGTPHSSSDVHKRVIADLGHDASHDTRLEELRELAGQAKNALLEADLAAFGRTMTRNTEVQQRLHPALVCERFLEIIDVGRAHAACGFKVNGAGGDGGSLTVLTNGDNHKKRVLAAELSRRGFSVIPIYLSRFGLRVW